jgi:hypothetical protein
VWCWCEGEARGVERGHGSVRTTAAVPAGETRVISAPARPTTLPALSEVAYFTASLFPSAPARRLEAEGPLAAFQAINGCLSNMAEADRTFGISSQAGFPRCVMEKEHAIPTLDGYSSRNRNETFAPRDVKAWRRGRDSCCRGSSGKTWMRVISRVTRFTGTHLSYPSSQLSYARHLFMPKLLYYAL